ncbi:TPA: hypothetical protein SB190_001718 [Campylobacter coli]|nr:hypothetical protein [Campylobacter jejuni]HEF9840188.1 hypothetical protein [Campylobacter coli]HEF9882981.1 hypothetical protein [Campylobacter coli]
MNIVDLVKTIESIENPQNLKIIREGACFYMCLGESESHSLIEASASQLKPSNLS